jgi:hypothetical protein
LISSSSATDTTEANLHSKTWNYLKEHASIHRHAALLSKIKNTSSSVLETRLLDISSELSHHAPKVYLSPENWHGVSKIFCIRVPTDYLNSSFLPSHCNSDNLLPLPVSFELGSWALNTVRSVSFCKYSRYLHRCMKVVKL